MKREITCQPLVAASLLAAALACAQTDGQYNLSLDQTDRDRAPRNRFGISYRLGFNISAKFTHLGGFSGVPATRFTPSGEAYNYNDGYVLPDNNSTHEDLGLTWYWSFDGSAQVVNDSLLVHRSSALPDGRTSSSDGDPQHGLEFTYDRQLGTLGRCRWGIEGAFTYTDVTIQNNQTVSSTVLQTTTTYALDGLNPYYPTPGIPYQGTREGPGPLIDRFPVANNTVAMANGAIVTGQRDFLADIFGFRLGPYLDIPISRKFAVTLSGGLAFAVINSELRYQDSVIINGVGSFPSSGSGSKNDCVFGGYFDANLSYALSRQWSLFMGAEYQYLPSYTQTVNGKQAQVDFPKEIFAKVGVTYSF